MKLARILLLSQEFSSTNQYEKETFKQSILGISFFNLIFPSQAFLVTLKFSEVVRNNI
jgi:hypothetical protein